MNITEINCFDGLFESVSELFIYQNDLPNILKCCFQEQQCKEFDSNNEIVETDHL